MFILFAGHSNQKPGAVSPFVCSCDRSSPLLNIEHYVVRRFLSCVECYLIDTFKPEFKNSFPQRNWFTVLSPPKKNGSLTWKRNYINTVKKQFPDEPLFVIEFHCNANEGEAGTGWEILYREAKDHHLAAAMSEGSASYCLNKSLFYRGRKHRTNLYLLNAFKNSDIPIILFELFFINNEDDWSEFILDMNNVAKGFAKDLLEYHQLK